MANDKFRGEGNGSDNTDSISPSQVSSSGTSAQANRELVQIGPDSPPVFSLDRLNSEQAITNGPNGGECTPEADGCPPAAAPSNVGTGCVLTPCDPVHNASGQLISPWNTEITALTNWAERCQWLRSLAIQQGEQGILDMVDRNERLPKMFLNMRFVSIIGHQGRGKSQFAGFVQILHIDDNIVMNADAFYRMAFDFARSLAFKNDAFEAMMVEIPTDDVVTALQSHGITDEEVIEVAASAHDATAAKVEIVTDHIIDVTTPLTTLVGLVNSHLPSINTQEEDAVFGSVLRSDLANGNTALEDRTLFLGGIDISCISHIHNVFTLFNEQRDLVSGVKFAIDITQSGDHQALFHMTVDVSIIRGFTTYDDIRTQNMDPDNIIICDDIVDRLNDVLAGSSVVPAHFVARGSYIEFSCNIHCFAPILLSTLMINGYTRLSALNENTKVSFSPYVFKPTIDISNGTLKGGQSAGILAFLGMINQLGEIANGGSVVEYRVDTPIDQFVKDAYDVLKGSNICLLAIDKNDKNWISTLRLRDRLMTQKASDTLEKIVTMIGCEANKLYKEVLDRQRVNLNATLDYSSSRAAIQGEDELIEVHKLKACSIASALISKKFRNGQMDEVVFEQLLSIFAGEHNDN